MRAESQSALVDFLNIELDLGFTFLELARTERDLDPPQASRLTGKIAEVLQTVRGFIPRVTDSAVAAGIGSRADSLESELAAFAP
jgi:hypothetical protein